MLRDIALEGQIQIFRMQVVFVPTLSHVAGIEAFSIHHQSTVTTSTTQLAMKVKTTS